MKKAYITLAALTRVEYCKEVEVPDETTQEDLDEMVEKLWDKTCGSEFQDDPDFWERGNCYGEFEKEE